VDSEAEITRLREWRHSTEKTLLALGWDLKDLRREFAAIAPEVQRLARSEEIAAAVAAKLRSQRTFRLTRTQRVMGYIGLAAVIADTVSRFYP
jgi:hypothetical protein